MPDEMGERTEQPTSRKLEEARERGEVAKSTDLAGALDIAACVIMIAMLGGTAVTVLGSMTRRMLSEDTPGNPLDIASLDGLARQALVHSAWVLVPGLGIALGASVLAHVWQVGLLFTTKPLEPNITKLNPLTGFKRLFDLRALIKTGMSLAKLIVVGIVATLVLLARLPQIAALPQLELLPGVWVMLRLALELAIWILAILLILGIIDYMYQRWHFKHERRMTKQEVKDELRSMEGDPHVKGQRLRRAAEIARQRLGRDVPLADVIVTNPTHFSVAIKYDDATMRAPKVIAKGADEMAFRIRTLAREHNVPIVERPPLARALYWNVDIGREINPAYYEAVAEVLAYVYRLNLDAKRSSLSTPETPRQPQAQPDLIPA